MLRSLSAFATLQHRDRRGSEDSTSSAFSTTSGSSDDSSIASSRESTSSLSNASEKAKQVLHSVSHARPALKRGLTAHVPFRRSKSSKRVAWADVD